MGQQVKAVVAKEKDKQAAQDDALKKLQEQHQRINEM